MAVHDKQFHLMALRRSATQSLMIDCSFEQVEQFLCCVVPEFTQQRDLLDSIFIQMRGLHHRVKQHGVSACQEDLFNAIIVLQEFLNVCSDLPVQVTFDVHTLIGQMKACLGDHESAVLSFTKALWIASCSQDFPKELTAAALHRIGKAYSMSRHLCEARSVLTKAVETYKAAGVTNHFAADAKRLLEEVDKNYRESPESWGSLRSSARQRLAQILE